MWRLSLDFFQLFIVCSRNEWDTNMADAIRKMKPFTRSCLFSLHFYISHSVNLDLFAKENRVNACHIELSHHSRLFTTLDLL